MILLSAFQALECPPLEVNNLDGRRDELDFHADLVLSPGSEQNSATSVESVVGTQRKSDLQVQA
jgi:hypothetical protein